mgnify:CR=1 FL=1
MAIAVSVVLLTYNSDLEKLKYTLNSIAMQKEIDYEVIIADDGSKTLDAQTIEKWAHQRFEEQKVKFLWNKQNQGTIKNYLSAVNLATGNYVYGISPGDYFYDEFVLRDLYRFAEANHAEVCFGKPQCYVNREEKQELVRCVTPINPEFFAPEKYRRFFATVAFFFGQFAVGATYFRKREFLQNCLKKLAGKIIYVEDEASTFIYLLEGGKLLYYNRFVVFYESNSGISTNKNHPLAKRFKEDEEEVSRYMVSHYGDDPIVRFKWIEPHFVRFLRHPCVAMCVIANKLCKIACKNRKQAFGNIENLKKIQGFEENGKEVL